MSMSIEDTGRGCLYRALIKARMHPIRYPGEIVVNPPRYSAQAIITDTPAGVRVDVSTGLLSFEHHCTTPEQVVAALQRWY